MSSAFNLYKANSPFGNKKCFATHLNLCLLRGETLDYEFNEKAKELDNEFIKFPYSHEGLTLYRAICSEFVDKLIINGSITYPAFMSTTYCLKSVYKHLDKCDSKIGGLLRIQLPKGGAALNMEKDERFGGSEREILLPRGSKFSVENIVSYCGIENIAKAIGSNNFPAEKNPSLKIYNLICKLRPTDADAPLNPGEVLRDL